MDTDDFAEVNFSEVEACFTAIEEQFELTHLRDCICNGVGCKYCLNRGKLSYWRYKNLIPKELK